MDASTLMGRMAATPPRLKAGLAGIFYVLSVLTAVINEFVVHDRLGFLGILIPIACQVVVTLLLFALFEPVNRRLSLLSVFTQLVTLAFEAFQLQPRGVNVGMVFHGFYCLLIGYLTVRSIFLPRILGALMAFAGVVWLIYLFPPLADAVAPYNTALGLLGEASLMLWLLLMGVNRRLW
jgi:hypothetical protein